jgi:drug/metabolite transporter (DMT)-like permease
MRNALQSELSKQLSTSGVTLARFLVSGPIAYAYLYILQNIHSANPILPNFAALKFMLGAAFAQILATALMVVLFKQHNYAVGTGLAKSEAVVAALLGSLFFGSTLSPTGWVGVLIGGTAVLILSGFNLKTLSVKTTCLGIACGTAFAMASLCVREAALATEIHFPLGPAYVL